MSADVKPSDCDKVLAALKGAVRLSRSEISNLFWRHRSQDQLNALAGELEKRGLIRLVFLPPDSRHDSTVEVWEAISQSHGFPNGSAAEPAGPPAGEGWVPKAATLKKARRGVVPAVAARAGRIARKKDRATRGVARAGPPKVSDEQRGATKLIGQAYRGYRDQGIIEEQGDWIRLVKNPPRRPPHHWYEALLHFVAEGHPTLDGKWRRKPKKTLRSVMEDALGRKLEPSELVRRRPGTAGSWDPDDIVLVQFAQPVEARTLSQVRRSQGDERHA